MKVDNKLLAHIADLARLELTQAEAKIFLSQLKEILNAFSAIDSVNTDKVNPSFHPVEIKNKWRDDKETVCLSQDDALANTDHKKDGYFKGPRVV